LGWTILLLFQESAQDLVLWPQSLSEHVKFEKVFELLWRKTPSVNTTQWRAQIVMFTQVALAEAGIHDPGSVRVTNIALPNTMTGCIEDSVRRQQTLENSDITLMPQMRQYYIRGWSKTDSTLATDEDGQAVDQILNTEKSKDINATTIKASNIQTNH
jgi:hypothetical protein